MLGPISDLNIGSVHYYRWYKYCSLAHYYTNLKITHINRFFIRPQQVDLWVRVLHVCAGTAACPWTADFRSCAPQAKIYRFVPFFF